MKNCFDLLIVGGGIIGVALARTMKRQFPSMTMAVLEKEPALALHQTGHNSGVIHAGIYYKPGTLKAKLCVSGMKMAYRYFDEKNIPYKKCGKLIIATDMHQAKKLDDLYKNSVENGVEDVRMVDKNQIEQIEPFCKGVKALHSPNTGIVDWGLVTNYYSQDFQSLGGEIFLSFEATALEENTNDKHAFPVKIRSKNNQVIFAKYVCTCGGLYADKLSMMSGCSVDPIIVPIRGQYLKLATAKQHLVKGNIYPVPDPRLPFLGVHFTPRMDGSIWIGPNAVLAFKKEGYRWNDFNWMELKETLFHPGFQKLALKYFTFGFSEILKSAAISLQVKELQKFIPDITVEDISRGSSGVRAQALDVNGEFVDDFCFDFPKEGVLSQRVLHCRNAPSPAATSSLAIAQHLASKLQSHFHL